MARERGRTWILVCLTPKHFIALLNLCGQVKLWAWLYGNALITQKRDCQVFLSSRINFAGDLMRAESQALHTFTCPEDPRSDRYVGGGQWRYCGCELPLGNSVMCLEWIHHLKGLHNAQNSFRNPPWKLLSEPQAQKYVHTMSILNHGRPQSFQSMLEWHRIPTIAFGRGGVLLTPTLWFCSTMSWHWWGAKWLRDLHSLWLHKADHSMRILFFYVFAIIGSEPRALSSCANSLLFRYIFPAPSPPLFSTFYLRTGSC